MNTTIKLNNEELNNTTIENNILTFEEFQSMSHEQLLERMERNMMSLRAEMLLYDIQSLDFQLSMDRLNRSLDKFSN